MSEHFDVKLNELLANSNGDNPHEETFPDVAGREFPNGEPIRVGFKRLSADAILPTKAHATDSGFDLFAAEDVIIEPGDTAVVPTGIAIQLPEGYEAQVRPRSGVTSKTKLRVQLGTIDQTYRGEIGIIVDNIEFESGLSVEDGHTFRVHNIANEADNISEEVDANSYVIGKGDKLAQLVVQPLPVVEAYEITGELGESERGAAGFGSTGVRNEIKCSVCDDVGTITDDFETRTCLYCGSLAVKGEEEGE